MVVGTKQVVFLLSVSTLFVGLLEGALRVYAHRVTDGQAAGWRVHQYDKMIYKPMPYIMFGLKPLSSGKEGRWKITSHGFRGEEFSVEKPSGVFRIIAIGGSTTFGYCIDDNDNTTPAVLERLLNDAYKGNPEVEVINAGVSGYMSSESLINFELRLLDLDPDAVLIYHSINDLRARLVPGFKGDYSHHRMVWSGQDEQPSPRLEYSYLFRALRWRLTSYRNRGDMMLLTRNSPPRDIAERQTHYRNSSALPFIRNMRSMVRLARSYEIEPMLFTFAYRKEEFRSPWKEGLEEHNAALMRLAEQEQVPIVDLDVLSSQDSRYWCDADHVTEAGAEERSAFV